MGYFDGYTANLFRSDDQQRRVVVPWGSRGPVYLVPTDVDAARITRVVRVAYQVMIPLVVGSVIVLGWRWMIVLGLAWLVAFYGVIYAVTRDLPRANVRARDLPKVSRREMQGRMALAIGRRWLVVLLVVSLLSVAAATWALSVTGPALSLYYVIGYGLLCSGLFAYQIRLASRQ
jgi:uncharacterized membrane protein